MGGPITRHTSAKLFKFYGKHRLFTLALVVLMVVSVISLVRSQADRPAYDGAVEKLAVGNIGEFSLFDVIAKHQGYFEEQGLDVDVRRFDAGPSAIAALTSGKVDIAVAADFVGVRNMFERTDLRILTQASKHQVFQVLGRKDKGVARPADLRGKRVGVTKQSAGEFYLGRFLSFSDMSMRDIDARNMPPAQIVQALRAGTIDAAVIFDPHAYTLKKQLGNNLVSWSAQGSQKTFALTYSTETYIQAHPEIIDRYLRALLRAEEYTKQHPAEARQLVARLLAYDPVYVDYLWQNATFSHALNQELLLVMEDQARWLIANKLTAKTAVPNYLNTIYFQGLDHIKPEAITIIR